MSLRDILLSITVSILLAVGQVLFKSASLTSGSSHDSRLRSLLAPRFLLALSVYGLATLLWVVVLRTAPLSRAYPIILMGAAIVPVLSYFAFGELITGRYVIGFALILVGLAIITTN